MTNKIAFLPPRHRAHLTQRVCLNSRVELLRYTVKGTHVWYAVSDGVDVSLLVVGD